MLIKDILLRDPSTHGLVNNGQARISNEDDDGNGIDGTAGKAGHNCPRSRSRQRPTQRHQGGADAGTEAQHRANRQVDDTGKQGETSKSGDNHRDRNVFENDGQVARRDEIGTDPGDAYDEQDQQRQRSGGFRRSSLQPFGAPAVDGHSGDQDTALKHRLVT